MCAMPSPWASSTVRWWRASVVLKWPFWRFDAAAAAAQPPRRRVPPHSSSWRSTSARDAHGLRLLLCARTAKARLAAMEEEAQKLKDDLDAGDDMNAGDGAGAGAEG